MENGQEFLLDLKNGKEIPFRKKKEGAIMVAESYDRLSVKYGSKKTGDATKFIKHDHFKKRYKNISSCGTFLEYKVNKETGEKKLNQANFCKVRLCPMCAWRRSLKIFGQVSKVMNVALDKTSNRFIFVTLTQKNVDAENLKIELDKIYKAFYDFVKRDKIKRMSLGWFRALEVTYNFETGMYHPHFHVVFMVKNHYFRNKNLWLDHSDWQQLWKESLKVDYDPQVFSQAVQDKKGKGMAGAVAEVAKYTVKEDNLIIKDEDGVFHLDETDENIKVLDDALAGRRLTAFGGQLKDIHKHLKMDDAEYGDLIVTDQDQLENEDLNYVIVKYFWHVGFSNYVKISSKEIDDV